MFFEVVRDVESGGGAMPSCFVRRADQTVTSPRQPRPGSGRTGLVAARGAAAGRQRERGAAGSLPRAQGPADDRQVVTEVPAVFDAETLIPALFFKRFARLVDLLARAYRHLGGWRRAREH